MTRFYQCTVQIESSYQFIIFCEYQKRECVVNLFSIQEIANLLALEEATLSTDLQQGYALKSLTGES